MEQEQHIVYVLTNEAMPGLVKIGRTGTDLKIRLKQLYSTGVPVPFECVYACKVGDCAEVEKTLHFAFGHNRLNVNREFFKIEPERVVAVLKLVSQGDVTSLVESSIDAELTPQDKAAGEMLKKRRPKLDFHKLNIPTGAELTFQDGEVRVKVVSHRKVEFEGEETFLVRPTRKLLSLPEDYPIQPSPYWSYNGVTLKDLYEEHHGYEVAA